MSGQGLFSYISTRAGADPVRTVFVLVPEAQAASKVTVEAFVRATGWVDEVERAGDVLVAPVAPDGWEALAPDLPMKLYLELRRSFHVAPGAGIPGSHDTAWMWETLLFVVGYGEGAAFAGNFLLAHPGFAAATVLVDERGCDFAASEVLSEHWLVPNPHDYHLRNRDVSVCAWLMGEDTDNGAMADHLARINDASEKRTIEVAGAATTIRTNAQNPAACVLSTPGLAGSDPAVARAAYGLFERIIRWKSSPDGELACHISREDFFCGPDYAHGFVEVDGTSYHYATYVPRGVDPRGLALVVSVHGRGEPTWLFAQKNGWERLADETGGFCVVLPDSPKNLWIAERDQEALRLVVEATVRDLALDATRVYLTGFSNGAVFTCQMATAMPELFAAASPWNSPGQRAVDSDGLGRYLYHPDFATSGFEMPFWTVYGDADDKAPAIREEGFDEVLVANGCAQEATCVWDQVSRYTAEAGYAQGERLKTEVFVDAAGIPMAGYTMVRDMPHGAFADEARACWEFVRHFRRSVGQRKVEVIA